VETWHWPRRCRLLNNSLSTGVSQYFGNKIRGLTNVTLLNARTYWFSTPRDEKENEKQEEERKKETTFVLVENKKICCYGDRQAVPAPSFVKGLGSGLSD